MPVESRGRVSTSWPSLSEIRCESVFIMAAACVSPPAAFPAALVSRVRASSPVALRAGSAAPSLRESSCRVAPASSSQPYVFFGQPSDFAAAGTIAIPTGLEATLPTRATSVASLSAEICSTHTSESGTHTCTPGSLPAASVSLTLYDSRAVTVMSTQRPSEVRFSSRARSAALRRAGATSGEAASSSRTASSRQEEPKESRPPWTAAAVPPATVSTRTVAMATVRRRARGRGSLPPAPY